MIAVAERPRATVLLPEVERLTERQLLGIDCALCGAYLGVDARRLGEVMNRGYVLQLFGCFPQCAPVPLTRRAAPPPWRGSLLDRLPRWTAAPSMPDPLSDDYRDDPETVRRVVAGLRALTETPPQPTTPPARR